VIHSSEHMRSFQFLRKIFHHRGTEDTELDFLFAHRETTMGKKNMPSGKEALSLPEAGLIIFACRYL